MNVAKNVDVLVYLDYVLFMQEYVPYTLFFSFSFCFPRGYAGRKEIRGT